MSLGRSLAAIRPPQTPPIPAGSGDNVHGSTFSGAYNPWTIPFTNVSNAVTANTLPRILNNAALADLTNPPPAPLGFPRDMAYQKATNWYSPWLGYLNNSPPGYVSPYYLQECTSLLGCRGSPTYAGCRACVGASGGSPYCASAVCNREAYPGYYYYGYPDYYSTGGYFGYPSRFY